MVALALLASLVADPALTRLQAEDGRVAAIAWRMQTANVDICPQKENLSGMSLHALTQYPGAQRVAAMRQLGLGRYVAISAVAPDSAAAKAGLAAGDAILSINGVETPVVLAGDGYTPVGKVEDMLEAALVQSSTKLRVSRAGVARDVVLSGQSGCASRVQIIAGNSINAGADGKFVQINARMIEFVRSDDELATVIGHELAHNILRHKALKTASKQAEYEADALGVSLVARAGFDVNAVLPFWTRFEKRTNAGIFADGTHPDTKKRLAAVAAAIAALKAQRTIGQPLIPSSQDEKAR